jgi:hypothetical protein
MIGCCYEQLWMRIILFPVRLIFFPFGIMFIAFGGFRECNKCNKIIWRWQRIVTREEPFICEGENYPYVDYWHLRCYIKKRGTRR